jgi:3-oxoacyl-[acyl-carrier protein] reductase
MSFEGKTAIVTGAARGIGREIAVELARRGCRVGFNYRNSRRLADELESEIKGMGGKCLSAQVDVNDFAGAAAMVKKVKESFGPIDFLVHSAGVLRDKPLYAQTADDWAQVLGTNLTGVFNFTRPVIADMMKRGAGRIVCVASVSGLRGVAGQTNYSAAKSGIVGFVRSLAREVGSFGVTVNAVAPGFIETDMLGQLPEEKRKALLSAVPLGRFGRAAEVARLVGFLLSDDALYITGQVIAIDGGVSV